MHIILFLQFCDVSVVIQQSRTRTATYIPKYRKNDELITVAH